MSTRFGDNGVAIERIDVSAYTVPTDVPESDGTYAWDKTTRVIVEAYAGGKHGIGYTYADVSTATLIKEILSDIVQGRDAMNVAGCWLAMVEAIRNLGRPGIASMAIAVVHDHVRIEQMFFDGVLRPMRGELRPDLSRPGMGLELKRSDAARYAV